MTAFASPISTGGEEEWNEGCEKGVFCVDGGRKLAHCAVPGSTGGVSKGSDGDI